MPKRPASKGLAPNSACAIKSWHLIGRHRIGGDVAVVMKRRRQSITDRPRLWSSVANCRQLLLAVILPCSRQQWHNGTSQKFPQSLSWKTNVHFHTSVLPHFRELPVPDSNSSGGLYMLTPAHQPAHTTKVPSVTISTIVTIWNNQQGSNTRMNRHSNRHDRNRSHYKST